MEGVRVTPLVPLWPQAFVLFLSVRDESRRAVEGQELCCAKQIV